MRRMLDPDRGIIGALSRLGDIILLNILFLICSLPIVTAGASFTAMCSVNLQFCSGTEGYTVKSFFKAFKENFKQATLIWLGILAILVILLADSVVIGKMEGSAVIYFRVILVTASVLLLIFATYVFFLQARFVNPVGATIRNALYMSVLYLPRTVWMLLLDVAILFIMLYNVTGLTAVCLVFAIGGCAGLNYVDAHLVYCGIRRLEERI